MFKVGRFVCLLGLVLFISACGGGGSSSNKQSNNEETSTTNFDAPISPISQGPIVNHDILNLPESQLSIELSNSTVKLNSSLDFSYTFSSDASNSDQIKWFINDIPSEDVNDSIQVSFYESGYTTIALELIDSLGNTHYDSKSIYVEEDNSKPAMLGQLIGDLNLDRVVDSLDTSLLDEHLNSLSSLETHQKILADLDLDGSLSGQDLSLLEQLASGVWPTYSTPSSFPSEQVVVMHEALTDMSVNAQVSINGNTLTSEPYRPSAGYLLFTAPFQPSYANGGKMQNETVLVQVLQNSRVAYEFDLELKALQQPQARDEQLISDSLNGFLSNIEDINDELKSLIDIGELSDSEKEDLENLLDSNLTEINSSISILANIVDSLDSDTLELIELTYLALQEENGLSVYRGANALRFQSAISNALNSTSGAQALDSSQCPISAEVSAIRAFAKIDAKFESLDTHIAVFDSICLVLNVSVYVAPVVAPVAKACSIAMSTLSLSKELVNVASLLIPAADKELTIESSLDRIGTATFFYANESDAELVLKGNLSESQFCSEGYPYASKLLMEKLILSKFKSIFNRKIAGQINTTTSYKNNLGDRLRLNKAFRSVMDGVYGASLDLLGIAIKPLFNKFCGPTSISTSIQENEVRVEVCDPNLDFSFEGVANEHRLFKDISTYSAEPIIYEATDSETNVKRNQECQNGDVIIKARWNLIDPEELSEREKKSNPALTNPATGEITIPQTCLPEVIDIEFESEIYALTEGALYNADPYDAASCIIGYDTGTGESEYNIRDEESWTERWVFDHSSGRVNMTGPGYVENEPFNRSNFSVDYTEYDEPFEICTEGSENGCSSTHYWENEFGYTYSFFDSEKQSRFGGPAYTAIGSGGGFFFGDTAHTAKISWSRDSRTSECILDREVFGFIKQAYD